MAGKPYPEQRELRAAMALRGLTVKDVANLTGYSYNYVLRILGGFAESAPAVEKIRAEVTKRPV